jgi:large subunit ribosomal protein L4
MSEVKVYNISGESVGSFELAPEALSEGVAMSHLHRVVVSYEANLRQGSANTKTRGERKGSGKKLWKQKGTGRARMGSIRSPIWRGGGVTFGPKPRSFRKDMNKKERRVALMASLAGKLGDNEIVALDNMALGEAKTKVVASFLKTAGIQGRVLFVSSDYNADFLRASKNIQNVNLLPVKDLNSLDVLKAHTVVFEKSALENIVPKQEA